MLVDLTLESPNFFLLSFDLLSELSTSALSQHDLILLELVVLLTQLDHSRFQVAGLLLQDAE